MPLSRQKSTENPRESTPGRYAESSSIERDGEESPLITPRAVVLGALTIAAMFYFVIQIAQRQGSGTYVQSQYPIAAFMPFAMWLLLNVGIKSAWPRLALSRGELLTLFSMTWVVATIPSWMSSWVATLTGPTHFATPENQWAETFFNFVPWHAFPPATRRITDAFWYGLPEGMDLPWDGWILQIFNWLGVSMAVVAFGFCLMIVFQRQWMGAEKLTFPLAQMPMDMTRGFDGRRRMPDIFFSRLFWAGFGTVFLPLVYNVITYFTPGLPSFDLFWTYYHYEFGNGLVSGFIRVMPLMLMVIYLCPVDILGSMVLFHWLAEFKMVLMRRFGTPSLGFTGVNANNRFSEPQMILNTESHGAMVFVFLWSVWVARRHLRQVWEQVRRGEGDLGEVRRYRWAVAGMLGSAAYVIGWALHLGVSLWLALGMFGLMVLAYFVAVKLVAASGCAYIYPNRPYLKGESFFLELIGSIYIPPQRLVPFKVLTSFAFFGPFTIPAWPAMAHHLRIFSLRRQPRWVTAVVLLAFPVGFVAAAWALLDLVYDEGGTLYVGGRTAVFYDGITYLVTNPTTPNIYKWALWWGGLLEAAGITFLRSRFHWFPVHPIGLIFQYTHATWWYWINFFIAFAIKVVLLRYGGVKAYLAGKPFFYGLGIGYVVGVVLSTVVDMVWFPTSGHRVHWW